MIYFALVSFLAYFIGALIWLNVATKHWPAGQKMTAYEAIMNMLLWPAGVYVYFFGK